MAATALTDLVSLKAYLGITDVGTDAFLTTTFGQVSEMFESRTRRVLGLQTANERIRRVGVGWQAIVLQEWPNDNLVVIENGNTLVEDTDYELRGEGRNGPQSLYRISGEFDIAWPSHAKVVITSDEGAALTELVDLQAACNEQSGFSFRQAGPGGGAHGLAARENTSQVLTYQPYDLLPTVIATLDNYARPF